MVLLHLMLDAQKKLDLHLGVFHADHGLRRGESGRDARFVKDACSTLSLPFHGYELNMTPGMPNVEEAAREKRYALVKECLLRNGYTHAATGHTLDDQAETVVYRVIRGTGIRGLAGMDYRNRQGIIRPMLDIPKEQVRACARERGIRHVNDRTNEDTTLARNRIRSEIIPVMERMNPQALRSITSLAQIAREEGAVLEKMALDLEFNAAVLDWNMIRSFRADTLRNAPDALVKRMFIHVISTFVDEPRGIDAVQVQASLDVLKGVRHAHTIKRKVRVVLDGELIVFHRASRGPHYTRAVEKDGILSIPQIGQSVQVRMPDGAARACHLRSYLSGDRINGKKVCHVLGAMKVPATLKPFWPVLADGSGVIAVAVKGCSGSSNQLTLDECHGR